MILNETQYEVVKARLAEMNASIGKFDKVDNSKLDWMAKQGIATLKGWASDMQQDIDEYQFLKSGKFVPPTSFTIRELRRILIQTRIARGLTQHDLADALSMDYSRMMLYEAEEYWGASCSKLLEIADKLSIDVDQCLHGWKDDNDNEKILRRTEEFDWNEFPVDEAIRRGWIENSAGKSATYRFKAWFSKSTGPYATFAYHRRKENEHDCRAQGYANQSSIFTWQARVLQLAKEEIKKSPVNKFRLDHRWLKELAKQTAYEDGPIRAKHCLREKGIILVIVKDLPNTFLDGAAMLSHEGVPIVALTLRYNRLDYFWYTLFHELGHVYRDLFDRKRFHLNYFDQLLSADENQASYYREDEREIKTYRYLMNQLIDAKTWDTCQSRYSVLVDDVKADAERIGVHPSVVAGRIRFERNDYSLLSDLIGQGQLHKHFAEYGL